MLQMISRRWHVALKVLPLVLAVVALKVLLHYLQWEFLTLNALFSGLVAANVFLLGFLMADVVADYKEGEKYPGDLAWALESMFDEATIIFKAADPATPGGEKKAQAAHECQEYLLNLAVAIRDWLYRRITTAEMMDKLGGINDFVPRLEPLTQVTFLARFREDQRTIRRILIRIRSIQEESFLSAGYAIGGLVTFFTVAGLLLTNIGPYYESLFLIGLITFFLVYLLAIIGQLENPFDYYSQEGGMEEISLKPLEHIELRMREKLKPTSSASAGE